MAPRATKAGTVPGSTAGTRARRAMSDQRVLTTAVAEPGTTDHRRHDQVAVGSGRTSGRADPAIRRRWASALGRARSAVTLHSPGVSPYTQLEIEIGPLP